MACLGAIEELGWPLDRIVTADVWANDDTPAELPPVLEFKRRADKIIKERWGIEVEHVRGVYTYEQAFYRILQGKNRPGTIYGWPIPRGPWCNSDVKLSAIRKMERKGGAYYVGIAADEPQRFHSLNERKISPLIEVKWTENDCMEWCRKNELLSPLYKTEHRGGCWFCHNQKVDQLRRLRRDYPEYWAMMLRWDADSPVSFKGNGRTLHDFEMRFAAEDAGKLNTKKRFYWKSLDKLREEEEKVSEDK